jgi:hypothetical protein
MIRNLYIYWNTGFENAPELVKKCLISWKIFNKNWNIIELNDNNLNNYIDIKEEIKDLDKKKFTPTHFSDVIRIFLLKKYGGLWTDATTFCIKPLDSWLPDCISSGFFAYQQVPARMLGNWFLYGEKDNYIVNEMFKEVINYVNNCSIIGNNNSIDTNKFWNINKFNNTHYFWFHYLFVDKYHNDKQFKSIWDSTKKMSIPNNVLKELFNNIKPSIINIIDNKIDPLYKLTHKFDQKILSNKNLLNYFMNLYKIKFIHIGKCAGTAIVQYTNLNEYHLQKPKFKENEYYVIWVRNPIHRFVSAFNYAYSIINTDTSKLNKNKLTLDNCLAPARIHYKMTHDHAYSKRYDELVNYFKTANNLAESLSSDDLSIKNMANELMTSPIEHINQGIGWYLDNGDFIEKYHDNILLVGKQETLNDDIIKLGKLLNIQLPDQIKRIRDNSNTDKTLSKKATDNIIEFYKDTDYKALEILNKYGFINDDYLKSCYKY